MVMERRKAGALSAEGERPSFRGLLVHRDSTIGYSLLIPLGWQRLELESAEGQGVIYAPSAEEVETSFSVEGRDLGTPVTADDLPALREGFFRGLRAMPGSWLESWEAEAIGSLVTMEARHTFRQGEATRKRWVRLLYQGSIQVRLVAQGASVEAFHYWLPMFYESMRTFRFGDWRLEMPGPPDG
jgi:hypothetical protein